MCAARSGILLIALLAESACCLADVSRVSGGTGAGTGSGTSGGTSTGRPAFDAGTCSTFDGVFEAGTWGGSGSCIACDPTANPTDWTHLDAGAACEVMASSSFGPQAVATVPVTGRCSTDGHCLVTYAAGSCDGELFGCPGGFCNDAGWCEVNQNLGWFDSCSGLLGMVTLATLSNPCAQGPCCLDAGYQGVTDGGGWCCGLIDGGVETCLAIDEVCYATPDCCQGLRCAGIDGILKGPERDLDGGYGLCIPD